MKEGYINEKNGRYLLNPRPRLGRFYLLPKIHKRLEKVPGRPVISNCGTATERISEFLDFYIQPLVDLVPSIIKDTNDFLLKLKELGGAPRNAIICTIDVVGLYPHILHCEGLEGLKKAINDSEMEIPSEHLLNLARLS